MALTDPEEFDVVVVGELEAFIELVGGVSSGESALINADTLAERIQSQSAEFASAADTSSRGSSGSMVPLLKSSMVRTVMGTMLGSAHGQIEALLGENAQPEVPLVPGGLVASPGGMYWLPADG